MRTTIAVALVMFGSGLAAAQPGMTEPQPPAGAYVPYAPAPYAYQPQVVISAEDRELLAEGEISSDRHIGGGITSLFFGFGIGQAVQGRWTDTGWIFTVGEPIAFTVFMAGIVAEMQGIPGEGCTHDCHGNRNGGAMLVGGMLSLAGLRIWEIADAFIGPSRHNARVRAVRARLGYPPPMYSHVTPYVAPTHAGDGGVAGVGFRF